MVFSRGIIFTTYCYYIGTMCRRNMNSYVSSWVVMSIHPEEMVLARAVNGDVTAPAGYGVPDPILGR